MSDEIRLEGMWDFKDPKDPVHPMDDPTPVKISAGALYTLMCGGAIACGSFKASEEAKESVIMALTVTIPEAKQILKKAGCCWD